MQFSVGCDITALHRNQSAGRSVLPEYIFTLSSDHLYCSVIIVIYPVNRIISQLFDPTVSGRDLHRSLSAFI